MDTTPQHWIAALRQSQDRLAALAHPLTPEDLRGPSYHSWTIAQVLGHLGSQAELFATWLTAVLEGTEPPGREAMQPIWDAWDSRTPEAQAADSLAINERLAPWLIGLSMAIVALCCVTVLIFLPGVPDPIVNLALTHLLEGPTPNNWGLLLGLRGPASLLPLGVIEAALAAALWRATRRPHRRVMRRGYALVTSHEPEHLFPS